MSGSEGCGGRAGHQPGVGDRVGHGGVEVATGLLTGDRKKARDAGLFYGIGRASLLGRPAAVHVPGHAAHVVACG